MNWFQNGHIDHVDKCFGSYIIDLSLSPRNLVFVNTIGKILTLRAQGHGQVMGFCGATAPLSSLREQGDRCYRSRNFLGHSGSYYTFHGFHRSETEHRSENTFKRNWVLLNAQELNIQMCPFCFEGQTVLSASARTCTWSEYGISTHFYRVRVSGIVYQS